MNTLEFLRLESRNALSTPNLNVESVYNRTTYVKPKSQKNDLFEFPWQKSSATVVDTEDTLDLRHFNNLPARTPVDLQFKDISYYAETGVFRKNKKEILHRVNGKFPGSQLIAIMGPSGAGKSTLLDVLSGFRITNTQGAVYLNGRIRNLDQFRKMSCYIQQEDRLQMLLTVLENMRIAADLKLSTELHSHEKETIIEDILTVLGLYEHQHTLTKRLSGGQKKRLSIALELINNPTIMFLDEPTTGLDSHSCTQVVNLCKTLASQGRTIICTIHQPSAKLFKEFDQVYILAEGNCLYQGSTDNVLPFLERVEMPCPLYHNPADYVIELASGEYGQEIMQKMIEQMANGECLDWFSDPSKVQKLEVLRKRNPLNNESMGSSSLHATSKTHQLGVLLKRSYIKAKRDSTLTYLRFFVSIIVAVMLGLLFIQAGNEGSRVLDNYNLLFGILIHHMMTTKMLTILTFPFEMSIIIKEHFNRWYSLKMYYSAVTLIDLPISIICTFIFSCIIYWMSAQPLERDRFLMFFFICQLVVFVASGMGLMIGAWFDVVNGTFLGPTIAVPFMMFAGFGVTLRDMPSWLYPGTYVSYLKYGLEGMLSAIYGGNRATLDCNLADYCHYKYPKTFLEDISMRGDQFWNDVLWLSVMTITLRVFCFYVLKWKIMAVR
ncbi:ATP-binding cassette sub-family G member 4 [Culicoides brevitarsis]|uniref:ATP-binding cassette sub-family G member 4 n=1 Tax=Culicoides brevitarsis TaxID=469753 RepID=UPI00307B7334